MPTPIEVPLRRALMFVGALFVFTGCGGEPSQREVGNARAFESLLSAVVLKDKAELERDAQVIDQRHGEGTLSDARYDALRGVIAKARAGDWAEAEHLAYEFRKPFGDRGAYFK